MNFTPHLNDRHQEVRQAACRGPFLVTQLFIGSENTRSFLQQGRRAYVPKQCNELWTGPAGSMATYLKTASKHLRNYWNPEEKGSSRLGEQISNVPLLWWGEEERCSFYWFHSLVRWRFIVPFGLAWEIERCVGRDWAFLWQDGWPVTAPLPRERQPDR